MSSDLTQVVPPAGVLILPPGSAGLQLTPRQRVFCQQWVKLRNGTKAAKAAGYSRDNNEVTLSAIASENLRKPQIQAYIDELFREQHIGHDETLAELGQIARAEITKKGIFRPQDKLRALELAGKHHRLWDQPDEQTIDTQALAGELAQMIVQAVDRIKGQDNTPTIETAPELAQQPVTPAERRLLEYQAIPTTAIVVQSTDANPPTEETAKY